MTEHPANALGLIIGSAIGLAGFSGIVVVLRSTSESSKYVDKFRVGNLLATSLAAGLIAFIAVGLSYTDYTSETIWRLSSGVFCCVVTGLSFVAYFQKRDLPADEVSTISAVLWVVLFGGVILTVVIELLNALALIPGDRFLIFYFGLVWLLVVAGTQFVRTIFARSTWDGT